MNGVKIVDISITEQKLIVELSSQSATIAEIQQLIEEKAGIRTVVKGIGENLAAVSEISGPNRFIGVVRFTQLLNQTCLFDGVIDGLSSDHSVFAVNIHEFGDLSGKDFENVGSVLLPIASDLKPKSSRVSFKSLVNNCELSHYIGRSLAISESLTQRVLGAGIVARASSIGSNEKKVCACSGKTLWEERSDSREGSASRL